MPARLYWWRRGCSELFHATRLSVPGRVPGLCIYGDGRRNCRRHMVSTEDGWYCGDFLYPRPIPGACTGQVSPTPMKPVLKRLEFLLPRLEDSGSSHSTITGFLALSVPVHLRLPCWVISLNSIYASTSTMGWGLETCPVSWVCKTIGHDALVFSHPVLAHQPSGHTISSSAITLRILLISTGPLAGTYILADRDNDWRWTQWLVLLIGAPLFIGTLLTKETSKSYILRHENPDLTNKASAAALAVQKVKMTIFRSVKMLLTDIVVFSLTIYSAYAYALTFSYFASIPYVFPRFYGFTPKQTSLAFLSIMIGYFLAVVLFAFFDKTLFARASKAVGGGLPAPEHRLYSALAGSIFLPIGLFW